jgi:hypothetical protein
MAERVSTRDELAAFVEALRADLIADADNWETRASNGVSTRSPHGSATVPATSRIAARPSLHTLLGSTKRRCSMPPISTSRPHERTLA